MSSRTALTAPAAAPTACDLQLVSARNLYAYPRAWVRGIAASGTKAAAAWGITPGATNRGSGATGRSLDQFNRRLLDSSADQDVLHGLTSVMYWGFALGPQKRLVQNRALARAGWLLNGNRRIPTRAAIATTAATVRNARVYLKKGQVAAALAEISRIPWYGQVSFASKVLAFMDPDRCAVFDKRIADSLSSSMHPALLQLSMNPNAGGVSAIKAMCYSAWCEICADRARDMNNKGLTWQDSDSVSQPWRAVDVERAYFESPCDSLLVKSGSLTCRCVITPTASSGPGAPALIGDATNPMNVNCPCAGFEADPFLVHAVQQATRSFVDQRGVLATIRNGGWEQSFRNRVLDITEDRPNFVGFAETSEGAVSRIDLAYRCRACHRLVLAAEAKINFSIQFDEVHRRRLEACRQLERLLQMGRLGYLVYVVTDQWWYDEESPLVRVHNASVPWYKEFVEGSPPELPPTDMFAKISPLVVKERDFEAYRVRLRVRVWLARCVLVANSGDMSLNFLNEQGQLGAQHVVTAQDLASRRRTVRPTIANA
jgi:hypothetical protein